MFNFDASISSSFFCSLRGSWEERTDSTAISRGTAKRLCPRVFVGKNKKLFHFFFANQEIREKLRWPRPRCAPFLSPPPSSSSSSLSLLLPRPPSPRLPLLLLPRPTAPSGSTARPPSRLASPWLSPPQTGSSSPLRPPTASPSSLPLTRSCSASRSWAASSRRRSGPSTGARR